MSKNARQRPVLPAAPEQETAATSTLQIWAAELKANAGKFWAQNLWAKLTGAADSAWFAVYESRSLRLRKPFPRELDFDYAAVDEADVTDGLLIAVRSSGGRHAKYVLHLHARQSDLLLTRPHSEQDAREAVLAAISLAMLGVRFNNSEGEQ